MSVSVKLSTPPTTDELIGLANLPGYGMVERIMDANGLLDYSLDPNYHPFMVTALAEEWDEDEDGTYLDETEGYAEIWARDLTQAEAKAQLLKIKDFTWELQTPHADPRQVLDGMEIFGVEALERLDHAPSIDIQ